MGIYDQFFKEFLRQVLEPWGHAQSGATIGAESQEADFLFVPDPTRPGLEEELGLLGRIASTSCLIEAFHNTPSRDTVLDCYRKQLALHHRHVVEQPGTPVEVPRLWILSSGRPEGVLTGLGFAPADGWPEGVYTDGRPGQPVWLVVIRELPAEPQTLFVRLMGAGPTLSRALDESRPRTPPRAPAPPRES